MNFSNSFKFQTIFQTLKRSFDFFLLFRHLNGICIQYLLEAPACIIISRISKDQSVANSYRRMVEQKNLFWAWKPY